MIFKACQFSLSQERINGGPPDSEREAEFQKNKEVFESVIKRIIQNRKEGSGQREIPFIDSLLQNYDSEEKVRLCEFMSEGTTLH